MTLIYRIIGFFINLVAVILAVSLIVIVPTALGAPALWFPVFLIVAVILYCWFSFKFQQKALKRQEIMSQSVRDMIRVNGIASIVFIMLDIPSIIFLLSNPQSYIAATKEMMKQYDARYQQGLTVENVNALGIVILIYLVALLVHILWTFALMRKNKNYFQ